MKTLFPDGNSVFFRSYAVIGAALALRQGLSCKGKYLLFPQLNARHGRDNPLRKITGGTLWKTYFH